MSGEGTQKVRVLQRSAFLAMCAVTPCIHLLTAFGQAPAMMLVEKVVAMLLRVLSVLGSCLFRLFFGSGGVLFFLGLVVLVVFEAVVWRR